MSRTDLPIHISEAIRSPQKELTIELANKYQTYHADIAEIVCISNLDNTQKLDSCYIQSGDRRIEYRPNKFIKYRNYDPKELINHLNCLPFFLSIDGVINQSSYVPDKYSGVLTKYHSSGLLSRRQYYLNGNLTKIYGYYNNKLNNIRFEFHYSDNEIFREVVYDPLLEEKIIAQFMFRDRTIYKKFYYGNNRIKSVYQSGIF